MQKIKLIMSAVLLCAAMPMSAVITNPSFEDGGLAYNITSTSNKTVEVGLSSISSVESVTIPSTVTYNGITYNVTKIADYGFTGTSNNGVTLYTTEGSCANNGNVKSTNHIYSSESASNVEVDSKTYAISTATSSYTYGNNYLNSKLTSVSFADNCQIEEIGYCAFAGCTALTSFEVPLSVETIRAQAFGACTGLTDFTFRTKTGEDGLQYTNVKTIPTYCFLGCTSLETLYLPEGIEVIQNRALQYMFNLVSIHLPNTLVVIGSHFLCEAHAMNSLTIPASVKYIASAMFHGCCALRDVYLLGEPANLQGGKSSGNAETFGSNEKFGGGYVNNCTFHVYAEYLSTESGGTATSGTTTYDNHDVWKTLLTGDRANADNKYVAIVDVPRTILPDRWITCCLYENYTKAQVLDLFGEGTKIAYMSKAEVDKDGFDPKGAKVGNMYNLTFTVEKLDDTVADDHYVIRRNTPFMLRITKAGGAEVTVYSATEMKQAGEANLITAEHTVAQTADNGAIVNMIGKYPGEYKLNKWECYFKNPQGEDGSYDKPENGMGFYRATSDNFTTLLSGRCFWRVVGDPEMAENGTSSGNGNAKLMVGMTYDVWEETTTGVDNLHVKLLTLPADNVYTLSGQLVKSQNLPKGIYIVNGKKTVVK